MLGRTLLFLGGGFLVLGGLTVLAATNTTFLYKHPKAPDVRIVVDQHGARVDLDAIKKEIAKETGVAGLPRAVVPITDYDFGAMDPMSDGAYDFQIKNVGDAPLLLKLGPTSCKCTISGLSADKLLPGQSGKIRLEWFTGRKVTSFAQTAVIETNDPTQRHIALGVSGKIKMLIGFNQERVVVDRLDPGKSVTKEVLLYSQKWDKFEVKGLTTALQGVTFSAEAIDPQQAGDLNALHAQRIRIAIPGTLPQGDFVDTLYFQVQPPDPAAKPQNVALPLHGHVLRRLSIYGQGITGDGVVELGTVPRGVAKQVRLVMKVRDPLTELGVGKIETQPAFLKAHVAPHQEEGVSGLYDLVIELPDNVEPCTYLGGPSGKLTIDVDHPRIDDLKLEVLFAVAP